MKLNDILNNTDARQAPQEQEEEKAGELHELLLDAGERLQVIEQFVKNQIEVKDQLIEKLHRELESYRQGAADRFADQLMKAVIKIRKDMAKRSSAEDWGSLTADELRKEYRYALEDMTDLLEQQNVDAYSTLAGSPFDPSIHQAKAVPTDEAGLDRTVKESLGEGYRKGNRILIPEKVAVYQYNGKENG